MSLLLVLCPSCRPYGLVPTAPAAQVDAQEERGAVLLCVSCVCSHPSGKARRLGHAFAGPPRLASCASLSYPGRNGSSRALGMLGGGQPLLEARWRRGGRCKGRSQSAPGHLFSHLLPSSLEQVPASFHVSLSSSSYKTISPTD